MDCHASELSMSRQGGKDEGHYASPTADGQEADIQNPTGEEERPSPRSIMGSVESSIALGHEPEPATYSKSSGGNRAQAMEPQDTGMCHEGGSIRHGKHVQEYPVPLQSNMAGAETYDWPPFVMVSSSECIKLATDNRYHLMRIRQLQEDIRKEKARARQLEDDIRDQEHVIAAVHSNAIGALSSKVSSSLPDDKIRRELNHLFDGMARDWCLDFHATDKVDESRAADVLMSNNILANDPDLPPHLKINMKDETAAPVLLQAALAKTLCDLFLTEPFFLQSWLPRASDMVFEGLNPEVMTTWRVRTVEFLEAAFPPSRQFFEERAEDFVRQYACLLQQVNQDALSELTELMEQFGKLAIQLWKRHVLISVEGLEHQGLKHFRSANADMQAEDSVLRGVRGSRLDGRPVQIMVRPRIVSEPVHPDGQLADKVVWSKAVVWVSSA
ncbi:hypothetical protein NCS57_01316400 [Fusarium keratoplasticum]|uniref:Uncharacterized protein n=1 Tax=Fusarium keratoplasticum TaxID=1328300 RepID=A0ACC0QGH9_9HYPO|nr:hypothetical protein NCS57_01316400 [Fusarium keratoplasticum]KAI8652522.1 hypothetical protein NCS57_01316400 [Fusarium keratoplasticum]KAI8653251.1 hypothetical protein NCS55_01310100 [Fusarium keratoplasticum]